MDWREKLKHQWMLTRLAHEASQLEATNRERALVRRLVRKLQDGTLGRPSPETDPEESAVAGVWVGNEFHLQTPPSTPRPISRLATAALGAALLAGGAGLGAGVPLLLSALRPSDQTAAPESQQPPQSTQPDWHDTWMELRLQPPQ